MAGNPSLVCDKEYCPLESWAQVLASERGREGFVVEGKRCDLCGTTKGWEHKKGGVVRPWSGNINV